MGGLYEDSKVLFVWALGSVIQAIQLIWKLKNPHSFSTFQLPEL